MMVIEQSLFVGDDIELRFQQFHARHPEVAARLAQLAAHRMDMGYRRLSMKGLFEDIRCGPWHGDSDSPVKLNNDFSSRYTRLLVAEHPGLAHLFRTRGLKS